MRQTDPDGYRSLQMGFFPFGWSCETVEPARDACLGPVMSPDVHVPGAALPHLPPRASIGTLQFDESGRPRRYKSLQTGVQPAQSIM